MAEKALSKHHVMTTCDHELGRYMGCSFNFKGSFLNQQTVNEAIKALRQSGRPRFFSWMPTGFKCGFCPKIEMELSTTDHSILGNPYQSLCAVFNSTSVVDVFKKIEWQATKMYERNAFLHWFVEDGLLSNEFYDCLQNLGSLISDYDEMNDFVEDEPDI